MKVIIDQNIFHRILPGISFLFDELAHVKNLDWLDWNDHSIFMAARRLQFDALMTLDEDFNKLLLQHGTPPKIIWLKTGNCSTAKLSSVIISNKDVIERFLLNEGFDCLELYG